MRWVTDLWQHPVEYNTARSAFWRVIRAITVEMGIASATEKHWSSHLAWTNLYRVSPHQCGNPNAALQAAQRDVCFDLLKAEITALVPRRVLMLTGADWAWPFLERLSGLTMGSRSSGLVRVVGSIELPRAPRKLVVAVHPQGNRSERWLAKSLARSTKLSKAHLRWTSGISISFRQNGTQVAATA
jgi:hypothetical protein